LNLCDLEVTGAHHSVTYGLGRAREPNRSPFLPTSKHCAIYSTFDWVEHRVREANKHIDPDGSSCERVLPYQLVWNERLRVHDPATMSGFALGPPAPVRVILPSGPQLRSVAIRTAKRRSSGDLYAASNPAIKAGLKRDSFRAFSCSFTKHRGKLLCTLPCQGGVLKSFPALERALVRWVRRGTWRARLCGPIISISTALRRSH
jgi:hypothetical protein